MILAPIEIDIEVHKAIEARRLSFDERPNDILRREFGLKRDDARPAAMEPRVRRSRAGGEYLVKIGAGEIRARSLKEALKKTMMEIEDAQPGFFEKLSLHRTSRGRRIIARTADELYPGKPQLVQNCAERLNGRWWFDTNISRDQCAKYLEVIGKIGGREIILV